MTIEFSLMNLIILAISGTSAIWALMKMFSKKSERFLDTRLAMHEKMEADNHVRLDKRLDSIESSNRVEASQWQRVERELLNLKAELPVHYVRREDYIRGQSIIESKLDGLGTKLENAQLRSLKNQD